MGRDPHVCRVPREGARGFHWGRSVPASLPPSVRDRIAVTVAQLVLDPTPWAHTLTNWRTLARIAERELNVARLAEAHLDAAATLADLGGAAVTPGSL